MGRAGCGFHLDGLAQSLADRSHVCLQYLPPQVSQDPHDFALRMREAMKSDGYNGNTDEVGPLAFGGAIIPATATGAWGDRIGLFDCPHRAGLRVVGRQWSGAHDRRGARSAFAIAKPCAGGHRRAGVGRGDGP